MGNLCLSVHRDFDKKIKVVEKTLVTAGITFLRVLMKKNLFGSWFCTWWNYGTRKITLAYEKIHCADTDAEVNFECVKINRIKSSLNAKSQTLMKYH